MRLPILGRPRPLDPEQKTRLVETAVKVARDPRLLGTLEPSDRNRVDELSKALGNAHASFNGPRASRQPRPISAQALAQRAAASLQPSSSITPADIEAAMLAQGLDMVAPFAPGSPLTPYYGYGRQPRIFDYEIARNTTTQTRPDRIPFDTLLHLWKAYDVAQACTRYSINDLRSMRIRFTAMEGHEDNPVKEIAEAKRFLRKPDGKRFFRNWLAINQRNLWIFDSAPIYRYKVRGKLDRLINVSAMTIAPMIDYYGDIPEGAAPAYQQFIEGVPWDWLNAEDIIYEPFWPETDSPYGTPPLETVLVNANTDLRLQMYFLDFFTKGAIPEMIAIAPEGMTDPDAIAELEETYDAWTQGDQAERWGLRWLPNGTELEPYKPDHFDPDLAEYVMRRTVAAYGLTPQNLGILDDVNRATSDTQTDQQFRVSTLPVVGYYEDLLDAVLQDDLSLPVQVRFDTGREKEDRLTEAKAWYVAWQMGAVSSDEYRDKVMGLPIDLENPNPRTVDSQRLGPVPLSYPQEISGPINPLTFSPSEKPEHYRDYVVPGSNNPDPIEAANGQDEAALPVAGNPKAQAPQGASRQGSSAASKEARPGQMPGAPEPNAVANPEGPQNPDEVGYGWFDSQGSAAQGTAAIRERDDLTKWRANARKAVAKGKAPRRFADSAIRSGVEARVWEALKGARSREDVDWAFKTAQPQAAGVVVQAADTGRVLMVQRTPDKHDPQEAYARWEWPGGKLDHDGDTPWSGGLREWSEETGAQLPDSFEHVGNWTSPDGVYVGFVVTAPTETDINLDPDGSEVSNARWWDKADLDDPEVRDKVTDTLDRVTPLLKGWADQPRGKGAKWRTQAHVDWEQFHRHTDRIVEHYAPLVQEAMAHVVDPVAIRQALDDAYTRPAKITKAAAHYRPATLPGVNCHECTFMHPDGTCTKVKGKVAADHVCDLFQADTAEKALGDAWRTLLASAQRAVQALRDVLARIYGDGYMQGSHEAAQASGGEMPPWTATVAANVDWGTWNPGLGDAAAKVANGGLAQLLTERDIWIKDITDTQVGRIGDAIAEGIREGFPVRKVQAEIDQIVNDADRAYLVAETEYARAVGQAAMDTYRLNNVPELTWLAEPTACPRCKENEAASPQPTVNPQWPNGPIPVHPHERCAVAPLIRVPTRRTT